jgi:orotidine-5'-phosphate decarboxylase
VVGATHPDAACRLRSLLRRAFILVTGYGVQGASGEQAALLFDDDGLGAIVNSSRAITYDYGDQNVTGERFAMSVRCNVLKMIEDITTALAHKRPREIGTG